MKVHHGILIGSGEIDPADSPKDRETSICKVHHGILIGSGEIDPADSPKDRETSIWDDIQNTVSRTHGLIVPFELYSFVDDYLC